MQPLVKSPEICYTKGDDDEWRNNPEPVIKLRFRRIPEKKSIEKHETEKHDHGENQPHPHPWQGRYHVVLVKFFLVPGELFPHPVPVINQRPSAEFRDRR